ncbi:hypothetical protein [Caldanaerobius polysaccharolyticus]|uniref:hypothetical protein n=1 Tax=Caldanaerobius polysaccharolyticus TaxID=44256 RepID=UPI0012EBD36E|nr:hypothetical protein [Caldanaerobius polysaccharolyticus]
MKTLVSYFNSVFNAQRAMGALKRAGFDMVHIDIIDFESNSWGSVSQLVLKSAFKNSVDVEVFAVSDPMEQLVSGMYGEVSDSSIKLMVTCDERDELLVKRHIRDNGGIL